MHHRHNKRRFLQSGFKRFSELMQQLETTSISAVSSSPFPWSHQHQLKFCLDLCNHCYYQGYSELRVLKSSSLLVSNQTKGPTITGLFEEAFKSTGKSWWMGHMFWEGQYCWLSQSLNKWARNIRNNCNIWFFAMVPLSLKIAERHGYLANNMASTNLIWTWLRDSCSLLLGSPHMKY